MDPPLSRWIFHDLIRPNQFNPARDILFISSIPFRMFIDPTLFMMINDLLNSVVRVSLSYGGSHWFKSNSR